jgi:hypothetical protein
MRRSYEELDIMAVELPIDMFCFRIQKIVPTSGHHYSSVPNNCEL